MAYATLSVDLSEIDDSAIRQEYRERGMDKDIIDMFNAFKLGNEAQAMQLARKLAQDHTGKCL